ncbi:hypothetical protein RBU61_08300 [Tissierella sp. MB52-C2]|uniref:hypothetical protein n=1 Tax=Tissierella sp. MB52-C2 TaxID=3070999 RepID=UPI00280BB3ED|nr:hypothetical protein [Tissierella sp. MB52-C2]WMM26665.1 hypothetical protein RBU61_08300 [Tissierella sp. MB52-C2]
MRESNIKYKRIFDKRTDKYGQSATLYIHPIGERCPCFNPNTGYGNPKWHRQNPTAIDCDDECYINREKETIPLKAFIFPASDIGKKGFEEIVLAAIGQVKKDDYVYVGKSDVDIFNLSEKDYLVYKNKKWKIKNPDVYKIGDINLTYVALLELIGEDK